METQLDLDRATVAIACEVVGVIMNDSYGGPCGGDANRVAQEVPSRLISTHFRKRKKCSLALANRVADRVKLIGRHHDAGGVLSVLAAMSVTS